MSSKEFLHKLHKDFLNESKTIGINSYIQSLFDVLDIFKPKTIGDSRRIEIARENVLNIKRHVKKLEEKIYLLEEENIILKETNKK